MEREPRGAAFFRLEGAITPFPAWHGARWLSTRAASVRRRALGGLISLVSAARTSHPALGSGLDGTRSLWRGLEQFSRDRLEVLGADFAETVLLPSVDDEAKRLLDLARDAGRTPVLIAETIAAVAVPLASALGIEHVVSNRLELEDGVATGELAEPALGPELDPRRLRDIAEGLGVSLAVSAAYGASSADRLLLGAVGLPCGLHPDAELARVCRDLGWPIVGSARSGVRQAFLDGFSEASR